MHALSCSPDSNVLLPNSPAILVDSGPPPPPASIRMVRVHTAWLSAPTSYLHRDQVLPTLRLLHQQQHYMEGLKLVRHKTGCPAQAILARSGSSA